MKNNKNDLKIHIYPTYFNTLECTTICSTLDEFKDTLKEIKSNFPLTVEIVEATQENYHSLIKIIDKYSAKIEKLELTDIDNDWAFQNEVRKFFKNFLIAKNQISSPLCQYVYADEISKQPSIVIKFYDEKKYVHDIIFFQSGDCIENFLSQSFIEKFHTFSIHVFDLDKETAIMLNNIFTQLSFTTNQLSTFEIVKGKLSHNFLENSIIPFLLKQTALTTLIISSAVGKNSMEPSNHVINTLVEKYLFKNSSIKTLDLSNNYITYADSNNLPITKLLKNPSIQITEIYLNEAAISNEMKKPGFDNLIEAKRMGNNHHIEISVTYFPKFKPNKKEREMLENNNSPSEKFVSFQANKNINFFYDDKNMKPYNPDSPRIAYKPL